MSPDRARDRTLQLSQGLFGAPPGRPGPDPSERREPDAKRDDADARP